MAASIRCPGDMFGAVLCLALHFLALVCSLDGVLFLIGRHQAMPSAATLPRVPSHITHPVIVSVIFITVSAQMLASLHWGIPSESKGTAMPSMSQCNHPFKCDDVQSVAQPPIPRPCHPLCLLRFENFIFSACLLPCSMSHAAEGLFGLEMKERA
ncbi:hypothetical protein B0H66DRAFT_69349 [Apodospora peruviana]|uniref:Uncharacterized protein n=1 Tax=Apodospora peruviana TaxID=516989 RepID=A0AAE0IT95_9PEZI|nr:hypothetical protein B0H66DRAFT_69349 [Apodospora peruviana]